MPERVIIGLPRWYIGGPCIFARRLVGGLNGQGWDARILLTEHDTLRVTEEHPSLPSPEDVALDVLPAGRDDSWGMRWEALIRYLEERAPCFYLMLHDWRNNIVAPRLSNRVFLIGLIQAEHELDFDQATRLGDLWNAIVTVSEPLHFSLAHRLPRLAHRIVTIKNAVPSLESIPQKPNSGPLRIAYSGELRRNQKRLDDMVRIAYRLAERGTPFELTFFGEGAYSAELKQQAATLIERGQVHFAGHRDNAALLRELEGQHVFLLTSEYEGLSIALLEAMSRGCIPVVSDLVTQSLVVRNGVTGLTAPIGDLVTFTNHLAKLAEHPGQRQTMATAAFQTIKKGGYRVEDMVESYLKLFERVSLMSHQRRFVRVRDWLGPPPWKVGDIEILPTDTQADVTYANAGESWPDPALPVRSPGAGKQPATSGHLKLEDHKIIVAIPGGQISGVDTFTVHLVRQLRCRGLDARVLGARLLNDSLGLPLPGDIHVEQLTMPDNLPWCERWDAMIAYLEAQAPCIYLPNYDFDYSGVAPQLSNRVKVVCICHSDDPVHFEHSLRIGRACDAVVGVSAAISRHLGEVDPSLISRLHTIRYGIPLPQQRPERHDTEGAPLKIAYVGRFIQRQKRASDIIAVAQSLENRGVPFEMIAIGDGPDRELMEQMGCALVAKGRVSFNRERLREIVQVGPCARVAKGRLVFTGKLPNAEVMQLLAGVDAFLLPSAFEGLAVGLLEAMALGLVPVVSDTRSGVPELIRNGENGLIAPIGNTERFADHLQFLYQNPAERERMSLEAYRTIETGGFRLHDMIDRYMELFQTVVTQPFARRPGPLAVPRHFQPLVRQPNRRPWPLLGPLFEASGE